MADINEDISEFAKKDLLVRMLASPSFAGTPSLIALLKFLWSHRKTPVAAKHVKPESENGTWEGTITDAYVRERIHELQQRMSEYYAQNPDEPIQCVLPKANRSRGYQLQFHKTGGISACQSFWAAHLSAEREIDIVAEPVLFYWDDHDGIMMRFMDANIEGASKEEALGVLQKQHSKYHKESLIPGHIYIEVGSVLAAESIRDFLRTSLKNAHLVINKHTQREWQSGSPILIGNERTSAPFRSILNGENLAYRLDQQRYTGMTIVNPSDEETGALSRIKMRPDAEGNFFAPLADRTFGVVRRIRNPFGGGVMTFISSDGTLTTRQIAAALVDEIQLRPIFAKLGWSVNKPIPERFELLFSVKLFPGGFNDKASEVELICGRPMETRPQRKRYSSRESA